MPARTVPRSARPTVPGVMIAADQHQADGHQRELGGVAWVHPVMAHATSASYTVAPSTSSLMWTGSSGGGTSGVGSSGVNVPSAAAT